jgi:hypothetical protein
MVDPHVQDLVGLDRAVARAARALDRWRAAIARGDEEAADDDPFDDAREASGKSTWIALGELSVSAADEPLRAALRRWVLALTYARIGRVDELTWARETADPRGRYEGLRQRPAASASRASPAPGTTRGGHVSWREAWRGAASAPSPGETGLWLEAAASASPPLSPVRQNITARRIEVARRMGLSHPWEQRVPVAAGPLRDSAARFLERTGDLSRAVWRESLGDEPGAAAIVHAATAREAGDGWPARLTPRWLEETFGLGLRGMNPDLPPLPETVGAASFARAMILFGHAFRAASVPSSMRFSLAREPWFVGAHRVGSLFGALSFDPHFHARVLGLGARRAGAQARVLARTALFEARLSAARLRLADSEDARDAFEEVTMGLFGSPIDARFRGAWPAARDDEPARWLGLLSAPSLQRGLRETYDADWFRNPRAWTHLRSLGEFPAYEAIEGEGSLAADGDALVRAFEEALG